MPAKVLDSFALIAYLGDDKEKRAELGDWGGGIQTTGKGNQDSLAKMTR